MKLIANAAEMEQELILEQMVLLLENAKFYAQKVMHAPISISSKILVLCGLVFVKNLLEMEKYTKRFLGIVALLKRLLKILVLKRLFLKSQLVHIPLF